MEPSSALLALCAGNYSPHKGQWRGALMFSLICAWTKGWENNPDAGDSRRHRTHYDRNVDFTHFPLDQDADKLTVDIKANHEWKFEIWEKFNSVKFYGGILINHSWFSNGFTNMGLFRMGDT